MKVIIVGCGRLGGDLAYRLFHRGHDIAIIDHIPAAFNNLPSDFRGRITEGEALNQDVLHRAGIEQADALAAVTNSDEVNAVVAHIANIVYKVPNIIVRNYNPVCRPMLETFGIQIVSSTSWGAQRVEEMIYHPDIRTIYSAGNGEVEIYEIIVPANWDGRALGEMFNSENCRPVSITRAGRAMMPAGELIVNKGDVVLVSATFEGVEGARGRVCVTD